MDGTEMGPAAHTAAAPQVLAVLQIIQPAYALEPNPVEHLLEELRQAIEGRVYRTLQDKQQALESVLKVWQGDPVCVLRLCG
jgi:ATP/maltotriose-dependent transcriptional regulator MalT